jgi:hypothetical protein
MTGIAVQTQRQAVALQRASEIAQLLDPLGEPLRRVMEEPHPRDEYVLAETVASLAKTALEQRQHIAYLGERIEELEASG